jgi:hypothetical protein
MHTKSFYIHHSKEIVCGSHVTPRQKWSGSSRVTWRRTPNTYKLHFREYVFEWSRKSNPTLLYIKLCPIHGCNLTSIWHYFFNFLDRASTLPQYILKFVLSLLQRYSTYFTLISILFMKKSPKNTFFKKSFFSRVPSTHFLKNPFSNINY